MEAAGKRYIVHPSRKDEIKIWYLSDLHLMSKACAEDVLDRDLKIIKNDPNSFWIGGGDYCDFIGRMDNRFDPDCVADWVSVSDLGKLGDVGYKKVRKLFWKIKHKCLGLLLGNHEKKHNLFQEQNDRQVWLCQELGVPNLQYCSLFDVIFIRKPRSKIALLEGNIERDRTRYSVRFFCHHGAGFATTPGGKLNKLIQFMNSFKADVYMCGHVHDQVGRREPLMGANAACDKIVAYERVGVISGSYLKTYAQDTTTYGEQRGYRPVSLGAVWVAIKPETGEIRGQI